MSFHEHEKEEFIMCSSDYSVEFDFRDFDGEIKKYSFVRDKITHFLKWGNGTRIWLVNNAFFDIENKYEDVKKMIKNEN